MGFIDIKGKKYNRLKVLKRVKNDKYGNAKWKCKCDCGNVVQVLGTDLRNNHTKSCGCLQKEIVKKNSTIHGYSKTRIYRIWHAMKSRCQNKNHSAYKDYGAKGISVCKKWEDPKKFIDWAFRNGYKKDLTLERIDINKNYNPTNCTFVTKSEQNRNTSRNIFFRFKEIKITLAQLARKLNIGRSTLYRWYHKENLRNEELIFRYKDMPNKYKSEKGINFVKTFADKYKVKGVK